MSSQLSHGLTHEMMDNDNIFEKFIKSIGFRICHKRTEPKRDAQSISYEDAGFSVPTLSFLKRRNIPMLWTHQFNAINKVCEGHNVCVTTSTSSGKTEIFQVSDI